MTILCIAYRHQATLKHTDSILYHIDSLHYSDSSLLEFIRALVRDWILLRVRILIRKAAGPYLAPRHV